MTRNNEDFHNQVSPESLEGRRLFHVSPKENREGIESAGIKPQPQYGWGPKGVYMNPDKPLPEYGDDVYEITPSKPTTLFHDKNDFGKAMYSKKGIPTSDFKRVGHIYFNPNGHTEIHMHPEEHCDAQK